MSEKSFVMTNGAAHTIAEQLKKPSKVIFQCDDGHVLEFKSYEEIYDRLNKLAMMEQKFEVGVKPIFDDSKDNDNKYRCFNCLARVGGLENHGVYGKSYCQDCGTKMDWSDEE